MAKGITNNPFGQPTKEGKGLQTATNRTIRATQAEVEKIEADERFGSLQDFFNHCVQNYFPELPKRESKWKRKTTAKKKPAQEDFE